MTGPEHFKAAEIFLRDALTSNDAADQRHSLAVAEVHATLALAAATALPERRPQSGYTTPLYNAWYDACGEATS